MNERANGALLTEHEVLFLDFLGFASAVQRWDDDRMEELVTVLVKIAEAQSDFGIDGETQSDDGYKITTRPEITTFSDNLVVSYPCKSAEIAGEAGEVVAKIWNGMVRERMQNITAQVVMAALDVGLLVRGGLSRGKLYHHGGVVVGEAMVDAYWLEKNARYPRVAVSSRVTDNDRLFTDEDDVRCLDYISAMMQLADDRHGNAKAWGQGKLAEIETTIKDLKDCGHKAEKWAYFEKRIRRTVETW
jgi:hypothetical protein